MNREPVIRANFLNRYIVNNNLCSLDDPCEGEDGTLDEFIGNTIKVLQEQEKPEGSDPGLLF